MSQRWKHKESGRIYKQEFAGQMKVNGEWIRSMSYSSEDTGEYYTRIEEDFMQKFEPVN